jgi:hypothetical protein
MCTREGDEHMAKNRKTSGERKQDARVLRVGISTKSVTKAQNTGKSKKALNRAVKRVGSSRKKVERALRG